MPTKHARSSAAQRVNAALALVKPSLSNAAAAVVCHVRSVSPLFKPTSRRTQLHLHVRISSSRHAKRALFSIFALAQPREYLVGDDLLHVAGVDVEAGTVRVLAGVVAAVEPDIVTLRLSDGTVLEKIPRSSLAKWDVPYLADGTEVLAPAAAPSVSSARGRRHARYR